MQDGSKPSIDRTTGGDYRQGVGMPHGRDTTAGDPARSVQQGSPLLPSAPPTSPWHPRLQQTGVPAVVARKMRHLLHNNRTRRIVDGVRKQLRQRDRTTASEQLQMLADPRRRRAPTRRSLEDAMQGKLHTTPTGKHAVAAMASKRSILKKKKSRRRLRSSLEDARSSGRKLKRGKSARPRLSLEERYLGGASHSSGHEQQAKQEHQAQRSKHFHPGQAAVPRRPRCISQSCQHWHAGYAAAASELHSWSSSRNGT